jgi:Undecaprenyl-phosphate glucose phosphotransferase
VLYRYSEVFRTLLVVADLSLVGGSWLAAYAIRFHTDLAVPLGVPPFEDYLPPLLVILPLWLGLFWMHDLYEPKRIDSLAGEAFAVFRATAIGVVLLVTITFFARSYFFSRGVMATFGVLSATAVVALRGSVRVGLRAMRRRGLNLRYVLVVGSGDLARHVIDRIHKHPAAGLRVRGVLSERPGSADRRVVGAPVIGTYSELKEFLHRDRTDMVIVALPRQESEQLEKVLLDLADEVVSVKVVPELPDIMTLRASVEDLDGVPIIGLRESPMVGWAAVEKRAFDLVVSTAGLILCLPLLAAIALAIRLGSGPPVLYVQERMGLDGRVFRMFKFRTMRAGAESESGPTWAQRGDARRTRLGAWLRRFSVDELPQLWNVLRGDMSLVGPRPERPVFIEAFRREIPGYMLRHKVRAGMTGWAQVHGWRGDTSLHERVEHDIYYVQNWSLGLDVRILLMTLFRGHENAH